MLQDLDGRKLGLLRDARPGAWYFWWIFMSSTHKTAWNRPSEDSNVQQKEMDKATRYWGTRRAYVKHNFLLGFVEELGQGVKSIIDVDIDKNDAADEPDLGVIAVMADEAIAKASCEESDEDGDDEDEGADDDFF
ncbi:hypothetical protein GGR50DRAFT_695490 [Xylaria sp. CBS 124048]|nr:hypothetical protein GGR50DRAFT_695490 [Xylaria sp. CBS 124048]